MNLSKTLKIESLSNPAEINLVLKKGKKLISRYGPIFLYRMPGDGQEKSKVAMLLKKSTGPAVKRNYIKRILRHFVREHVELFGNYNRIIFIYNNSKDMSYDLLVKEYLDILSQI